MKKYILKLTIPMALAISSPAIAGPFEKFFQPAVPDSTQDVQQSESPPRIMTTGTLDADLRRLMEDGYIVIGNSSFTGPVQDPKKSQKQAKKIKAEIVLYTASYESTRSGAMPILMPNNSTATVNGNAYGSGGWGTFGGTVNKYGTTPVVVPFSVDRYSQVAVYLSKLKPNKIGLGLRFQPLTSEQARIAGTNKAIYVAFVIRGSAAFDADIMSDDIILSVGGRDVSTADRMSEVKRDFAGQTVPVEIIRQGQPKTLQISIPTPFQP